MGGTDEEFSQVRGLIWLDKIVENEIRDGKNTDRSRRQRRILEIAGRTIVPGVERFLGMKVMDEKRNKKENQDRSQVEISFPASDFHCYYVNATKINEKSQ